MWIRDIMGIIVNLWNRKILYDSRRTVRFLHGMDGSHILEKTLHHSEAGITSSMLEPILENHIYDKCIVLYDGLLVNFAYPMRFYPNTPITNPSIIQFTIIYYKDISPDLN